MTIKSFNLELIYIILGIRIRTGLQSIVFHALLHDVHGKSLVNDAKKNLSDQAIITL